MGEWPGQRRAAQVGASDRADHQRPAREQPNRCAAVGQEIGVVVGRVARCGQRKQVDALGEGDVFSVMDGLMRRGQV